MYGFVPSCPKQISLRLFSTDFQLENKSFHFMDPNIYILQNLFLWMVQRKSRFRNLRQVDGTTQEFVSGGFRVCKVQSCLYCFPGTDMLAPAYANAHGWSAFCSCFDLVLHGFDSRWHNFACLAIKCSTPIFEMPLGHVWTISCMSQPVILRTCSTNS